MRVVVLMLIPLLVIMPVSAQIFPAEKALKDAYKRTAGQPIPELHRAVHAGDLPEVRRLIEAGADANTRDPLGMTPLMSVFGRYVELPPESKKRLGLVGRMLNAKRLQGMVTISGHISDHEIDMVRTLVNSGADINATNDYNNGVFLMVAGYGSPAALRFLLNSGASMESINAVDPYGNNVLKKTMQMAYGGKEFNPEHDPVEYIEKAKMLVYYGADYRIPPMEVYSPAAGGMVTLSTVVDAVSYELEIFQSKKKRERLYGYDIRPVAIQVISEVEKAVEAREKLIAEMLAAEKRERLAQQNDFLKVIGWTLLGLAGKWVIDKANDSTEYSSSGGSGSGVGSLILNTGSICGEGSIAVKDTTSFHEYNLECCGWGNLGTYSYYLPEGGYELSYGIETCGSSTFTGSGVKFYIFSGQSTSLRLNLDSGTYFVQG